MFIFLLYRISHENFVCNKPQDVTTPLEPQIILMTQRTFRNIVEEMKCPSKYTVQLWARHCVYG